ncbi:MAG TPA: hypothetical protein VHY21_03850 [Pseudonocardiaceae bacterium]|jgi:hypothetical protein|nr:hypothetical protein [Pseudonocardiaceae bacterium]
MAPTIIRNGAAVLLAAGALATGAGAGAASATTLAPAPQQVQTTAGNPSMFGQDFCDDFNHRGDPRCRGDRWTWDPAHHRWNHDRWDGHRWNHRP